MDHLLGFGFISSRAKQRRATDNRTLSVVQKFRNFHCDLFVGSLPPVRRMRLSLVACSAVFLASARFASAQTSTAALYDQAVLDWTRGAYPAAMQKLTTVVSATDGASYLERVALL